MGLLTGRGHVAFGILWAVAMLLIIVGFSGVGGLRFAPWLLLLVPFAATRTALRGSKSGSESMRTSRVLWGINVTIEIAMVAIFVYMYNLAVLSYCPSPK
jgi:hypothetical protein